MARHHEVTRLEGFSDAVFGFALTLLVVSLEVPSSFAALQQQMEGFLGFALMFAMVCWIWYEHNWFFRHTGLQDPWTVFLNSVLLFVVLFYVYPLKFLTSSLLAAWFGLGSGSSDLGAGNALLLLYSSGVVLIFGTFRLLYRHARQATGGRTSGEDAELRYAARAHTLSLSIGLVSCAIALAGYVADWDVAAAAAGLVYVLMGPLHGWNGHQAARALTAIEVAGAAAPTGDEPHA
jgi:uncharacterized membrane protein